MSLNKKAGLVCPDFFIYKTFFTTKKATAMDILIRTIPLDNGLKLNVYDRTKRYYEAFYLVKLEVICEVPLQMDFFAAESDFLEAKKLLGDTVVYRRTLEHMGVASTELDNSKKSLLRNFEQNAIPYFAVADFPQKIVVSEFIRARKKLGSQQPGGRIHGRM